jgi:carboxypeptidase C (cathepsin A)
MICHLLHFFAIHGLVAGTYPHDVDHNRAFTEGFTPLSRRSQTGFVPVSNSSETFYWLFYADNDFSTKPILVWLQGQIGVTSLVGALLEFQPEWTQNFNLLFVDAPLGVGLSRANQQSDLATTSEAIASQVITFLEHFFNRYKEFRDPRVIIAGEDYAGHTIPLTVNLAQQTASLPFTVTGMAVGNGHTHPPIQVITKADSATIFGLLDSPECISAARAHAWRASVLSVIGDSLDSLNQRNLLEQTILNCSRGINMGNVGQFFSSDQAFSKVERWLNNSEHLEAIGVDTSIPPVVKNSKVYENLKSDIMRVIWGHIPPILDAGITTLWYQGQLDWVDGVYSNEAWLNALEWTGSEHYAQAPRQPWDGGYLRSYGPLNEAMLLGAGHLALVDKPREMLNLFKRIFLNHFSVPEESLVV